MTLPASSSINNYGSGVLVDAVPLVDPTSEMPAAAMNPFRNDCSAMTATAIRCLFQFKAIDSDGAASIYSSATWTAGMDSVWGNAVAVQPTIVRSDTGIYNVTMVASVPDQIGGTNLVNVRFVEGSKITGVGGAFITCVVTSASTFNIYINDYTDTPTDFTNDVFVIKVY
jgi:hypothetical protein